MCKLVSRFILQWYPFGYKAKKENENLDYYTNDGCYFVEKKGSL